MYFQKALAIFDVFRAHPNEGFRQKLAEHGILIRYVPAGCTSMLQPLDVAVNDQFKKQIKTKFSNWYAEEVRMQLDGDIPVESVNVNVKGASMKPMSAHWIIACLRELGTNHDLIVTAWEKAGILPAIKDVLGATPRGEQGIFDIFMPQMPHKAD